MASPKRMALSIHDSVRLTTVKGEAVQGSVHALDETTSTLVLRLAEDAMPSSSPSSATAAARARAANDGGHFLRFLSVKNIRTIEVEGAQGGKKKGAAAGVNGEGSSSSSAAAAAAAAATGRGSGGGINEEKLAKLEKESRGKAVREMAKINASASPKGQMSFDHISKIYSDTRWSGQSILIMDQVRIDPPYHNKGDIKTLDASVKSEFIDRLLTMMENADKKLGRK